MIGLRDQVQVSRMMHSSYRMSASWADALATSVPDDATQGSSSSCVTADAKRHSAHLILSSANSSLPPPRRRCYGLLSSALSLLVRKSQCNSYLNPARWVMMPSPRVKVDIYDGDY